MLRIQCRRCQLLSNYRRNICKPDRFTLAGRFTAETKRKKTQSLCKKPSDGTYLIPESGNSAAWVLLLLVFLSGYLSLAAAFWSAAHPVVFTTRTAIWIASGASHPILPSLDSKHLLQMPTNSQEKVLLQAVGSLLLQAWMRSRKTACSTSQPYARLPLPRYLQLPLPPAVTQAVQGRAFSLRCLAQSGGGKAGGRGGEREMDG